MLCSRLAIEHDVQRPASSRGLSRWGQIEGPPCFPCQQHVYSMNPGVPACSSPRPRVLETERYANPHETAASFVTHVASVVSSRFSSQQDTHREREEGGSRDCSGGFAQTEQATRMAFEDPKFPVTDPAPGVGTTFANFNLTDYATVVAATAGSAAWCFKGGETTRVEQAGRFESSRTCRSSRVGRPLDRSVHRTVFVVGVLRFWSAGKRGRKARKEGPREPHKRSLLSAPIHLICRVGCFRRPGESRIEQAFVLVLSTACRTHMHAAFSEGGEACSGFERSRPVV